LVSGDIARECRTSREETMYIRSAAALSYVFAELLRFVGRVWREASNSLEEKGEQGAGATKPDEKRRVLCPLSALE
jgi:hypothetical protein